MTPGPVPAGIDAAGEVDCFVSSSSLATTVVSDWLESDEPASAAQ
jgi:hypothetical protein